MKEYLKVVVTPYEGNESEGILKTHESYKLVDLAKNNKFIVVEVIECGKSHYKTLFENLEDL